MKKRILSLGAMLLSLAGHAAVPSPVIPNDHQLLLQKQTGFFRFSFDDMTMPQNIQNMGLLGINYFADFTPTIYGGIGAYGSVTGTQGGLFVLGFEGGLHHQFFPHWWGDIGLFVGGGGGRASLVGGGLMLRPHVGVQYAWSWARLGVHYSNINFTSGKIHSKQVGVDLDIPVDFYYVPVQAAQNALFNFKDILLFKGNYLAFQHNDFALLLQAYDQKTGTKSASGEVQDGTIGLVGAELDHYFTDNAFWYMKAAGAFRGIPNGYMDVLGGFGYHWAPNSYGIALVPQFGVGAGGGGNVYTGGGIIVQPQLGVEVPLGSNFAARASGGYLWSPKGNLRAATATGELIYHLDFATATQVKPLIDPNTRYKIQGWRIQLFNQTYLRPQRAYDSSVRSSINLIAVQMDQIFTPYFFFSYQAASAYQGEHAGGYATGMIGPGLQTPEFLNNHLQLFGEVLVGAGGGGGLSLGGGGLIEPVVGMHYAFTPAFGLQASVGEIKALKHNLNTPAVNVGFTVRFGMVEKK